MRFFNIDLHIGVISDVKRILGSLGHEVTDWSISAHARVLGRKPDRVDILNQHTWKNIDPAMCDAFYARYKSELGQYDGFIVTHTPSFSMLYERWEKPIICIASTRYEAPYSADATKWEHFNAYLRRQIDRGMLIPLANNKYDAAYAEHFTHRRWKVIPSLCEYTDAPYTRTRPESLYCSKLKLQERVPGLVSKDEFFKESAAARIARRLGLEFGSRGYSWKDIASFRSIVFVPYNASIMSIFEMYAAGIPMLFPSRGFAQELFSQHRQNGAFSELSYNQVFHLPSKSALPCEAPDPNDYESLESMAQWISLSDFYDSDNLKHLLYFDSFQEMSDLLNTIDVDDVHGRMVEHQGIRSKNVHRAWQEIIDGLCVGSPSARANSCEASSCV